MRKSCFSDSTMRAFTLAALCLAAPASLLAEEGVSKRAPGQIEPPDVFVRVQILKAEVELIRQEMARPVAEAPLFQVRHATPREVYYQAATLFTKSDRLAFDVLRTRIEPPAIPEGDIQPADVYALVDASLARVRAVKQWLSIEQSVPSAKRIDDKTPSDVFNEIVSVNRQLNLLIEQRFTPADVYGVISACVYHASRLEQTDIHNVIPEVALIRRKRPADVLRRLNDCYQIVHAIASKSGHTVAEMQLDVGDDSTVGSSDVYDIASLVLSEIAFLDYQLNGGDSQPNVVRFGGYKLSSDCFQCAGVLMNQLELISKRIP